MAALRHWAARHHRGHDGRGRKGRCLRCPQASVAVIRGTVWQHPLQQEPPGQRASAAAGATPSPSNSRPGMTNTTTCPNCSKRKRARFPVCFECKEAGRTTPAPPKPLPPEQYDSFDAYWDQVKAMMTLAQFNEEFRNASKTPGTASRKRTCCRRRGAVSSHSTPPPARSSIPWPALGRAR